MQKNATPSLTQRQAVALPEASPTESVEDRSALSLLCSAILTVPSISLIASAFAGCLLWGR